MAACQPHLEAEEGLELLESNLLCTQWFTCAGIFLLSGPAPEFMFSLPPLFLQIYFMQQSTFYSFSFGWCMNQ